MPAHRIHRYFKHGTLTQMRVFEAVGRLGSFTRAGEETHVAQPTVSVHMKKLAQTVGAQLVEHAGKRVHLTPAGAALHATVKRLIQTFGALDDSLSEIASLNAGALPTYNESSYLRGCSEMDTARSNATPAGAELLRTDAGGVTTLTLNRPLQYNAFSSTLIDALQAALDDISRDPAVRVVVIAGAGKAFCAGHDLKEIRARGGELVEQVFARFSALMVSLTRMPQPVIARVHGVAFAAGCQFVAQCDLAVASTAAQFATSGVNFGLFCNTPGVAVSRNVTRKQAMEMLLTGDAIDAAAALERGLVNRVVAPDALDAEIDAIAQSIVEKTPVAIAAGKRAFYQQLDAPLEQAYAIATAAMVRNMQTHDAAEGIDAFAAKRKPMWKGE